MRLSRPAHAPGHAALRRGRYSGAGQIYHVTVATRLRRPAFIDFHAASAASRCFDHPGRLHDGRMLAWVLMPDHAHWLLQLGCRDTLVAVVAKLKSASARAANIAHGGHGAIWSRAFHDHALRSDEDLRAIARYIVTNPVRAGLAKRIGDYPFWNATWL